MKFYEHCSFFYIVQIYLTKKKKEQRPCLPLSVITERKPAQGYMLFHPHAVSREDELR